MKKLTQAQVNALSTKIHRELKEDINKYNKSLESDSGFSSWKSTNWGLVEAVTTTINSARKWKELSKNETSYQVNYTAQLDTDVILYHQYQKSLPTKSYPLESSIKDEIILNTIESDNIDDVIHKIKNKFQI